MKNMYVLFISLFYTALASAVDVTPFIGASTVELQGNADSKLLQAGANVRLNDSLSIFGAYGKEESHSPDLINIVRDPSTNKILSADEVPYSISEFMRADARLGKTVSSGDTRLFFYGAAIYSLVDYEGGAEKEDVGYGAGITGTSGRFFMNAEYFRFNTDLHGVGINLGLNL